MNWSDRLLLLSVVLPATALVGAGCGPALRPPSLDVEKLDFRGVRLSGAAIDVFFRVRNVEPDPLLIEGFEYVLVLNGHRLGRGYYPDPVRLGPFEEAGVVSRFNVNLLQLPGSVRAVLDEDEARAHVHGRFFVRQGGRVRKLPFDSGAIVSLRR
jgi:LEA14-like dessication related protein